LPDPAGDTVTDVIQVFTTLDSQQAADNLGRTLVERRLAACAQVLGPISSTYWWEGAVESAEEWLCLIKTTWDAYGALEQAICESHPYDVPEILAVPVSAGHSAYLDWLRAQVSI
jgi:periplasmic divalent cation tolerance protein